MVSTSSTSGGSPLLLLGVRGLDCARPASRRGFDKLNQRWRTAASRLTGSRLTARFARCSTSGALRLLLGSPGLDCARPARRRGFDKLNQRWRTAASRLTGSRLTARFARCSTSGGVRLLLGVRGLDCARPARRRGFDKLNQRLAYGCFSAHWVSTDRSLRSLLDQRGCGCYSAHWVSTDRSLRQAQDKRFAHCSTSGGHDKLDQRRGPVSTDQGAACWELDCAAPDDRRRSGAAGATQVPQGPRNLSS